MARLPCLAFWLGLRLGLGVGLGLALTLTLTLTLTVTLTLARTKAARLLVARLCWQGRLPGGRAGVGGAVSKREAAAASVALNLQQVRPQP